MSQCPVIQVYWWLYSFEQFNCSRIDESVLQHPPPPPFSILWPRICIFEGIMRFSRFEFFMLNIKYFIYLYWQLLARQLEDQVNVTDPSVRSSTQTSAWRTGGQLHNLGAFLLELGRTTMTLRLGQTPVGLSTFPVYGIFSIMRSHVLYVLLLPISYTVGSSC